MGYTFIHFLICAASPAHTPMNIFILLAGSVGYGQLDMGGLALPPAPRKKKMLLLLMKAKTMEHI